MKTHAIALMLCLAALPAAADAYKCKTPAAQPPGLGDGDRRALKDAYESRMAKRDYEGAVAFASNDKEKHRALKLAEDKRLKCGKLMIRAQQARANARPAKAYTENAAIAAEREYNLNCR